MDMICWDMGTMNKSIQKFFLLLALIWMAVIFSFSSRTGTESTHDSNVVGLTLGRIFVSDFEQLSEKEQLDIADKMELPIRKSAHALEYALLGLLLTLGLYKGSNHLDKTVCDKRNLKKRELGVLFLMKDTCFWKNYLGPWMISILYATSDEFHQLFVPGRSGQITDVCIDSAGAFLGVVLGCELLRCSFKQTDFK